jgi:predicted nucleic acid-binding protein
LAALYGRVIIPPAVAAELIAGVAEHPEIDTLLHCPWLEVRTLTPSEKLTKLTEVLDLGEAEAIQLADEMKADLLLIDEWDGRQAALERHIPIIGLVGLLLNARKASLIGPLRPIYEKLIVEMRFRVSRNIIESVLKEVDE